MFLGGSERTTDSAYKWESMLEKIFRMNTEIW